MLKLNRFVASPLRLLRWICCWGNSWLLLPEMTKKCCVWMNDVLVILKVFPRCLVCLLWSACNFAPLAFFARILHISLFRLRIANSVLVVPKTGRPKWEAILFLFSPPSYRTTDWMSTMKMSVDGFSLSSFSLPTTFLLLKQNDFLLLFAFLPLHFYSYVMTHFPRKSQQKPWTDTRERDKKALDCINSKM